MRNVIQNNNRAWSVLQLVLEPPDGVAGPGLHERELDSGYIHHQSAGWRGKIPRGLWDPLVLWGFRPHVGASCRRYDSQVLIVIFILVLVLVLDRWLCSVCSGCFHDFAQSYDMAFYLGGSCMIASSLALSFIVMLCRRQTPFPLPPPPETEVISCTVTAATDATSP